MFIFYAPPTRTATVSGRCYKPADCEACGCAYQYEVVREGVGDDNYSVSWTNRAAFQKARAKAEKNLQKALDEAVEPVPCPDCGWVQTAMVEGVRKRLYPGLRNMARAGLAVGGGGALVFGLIATGVALTQGTEHKGVFTALMWASILGALGGAPGLLLWLLRRALLATYNPNREFKTVNR